MRRACILTALLLLGPALLSPPAVRAADNVSVGTVGSASANLWPVFIGIKKGFFTGANLNVDIIYVQSSANLVQQLAAGSLDITMSTGLVDPIRAIDQNAGISIVRFEAQAPPYAWWAKPAIKKLARPQGQGDLARRPQRHHPHLCRADAGAARHQTG